MSRSPEGYQVEELTVAARLVLLDALSALHEHADSIVIVGAQAVSLRADQAQLAALSSFTSDADLGIDPRTLAEVPRLEDAMAAAGFVLTTPPGTWSRTEPVGDRTARVAVDLLVPEAFGGAAPKRARSGRIPPHARTATRRVKGLEAAVVDNDLLLVRSLDAATSGTTARVAGVAALLVAKAHKIADRLRDRDPGRVQDKDAADVVRLMQIEPPGSVAARFRLLLDDDAVQSVVSEGLDLLRFQFGTRRAAGTRMAMAALDGITPGPTVEAIGPAYLRLLPDG